MTESAQPWLELLGRLHPLVVHLPVAVLPLAALFEFLRRGASTRKPSPFAFALLLLGTLGAAAAAGTGWLHEAMEPQGASVERYVFLHRWSGVAVGSLSLLAVLFGLLARIGLDLGFIAYRAGMLVLLLLVPVTGHFGATLQFGSGWFTAPFERAGRVAAPADAKSASVAPADVPAAEHDGAGPIVFERDVAPIFAAHCVECHGPKKQKGGLRLEPIADAFRDPPDLWVVRPGDAKGSELIRRVSLPRDDEDHMPPEDHEPLAREQIARLARWIDEGAHWPGEPAAAPEDPSRKSSYDDALLGKRDAALALLRERGARAHKLALDSEDVEVGFDALGAKATDADLKTLAGLEPFLVALDLSGTAVTGPGLEALGSFDRLRFLRLDHTKIGDAGLPYLSLLPALQVLNLHDTKVSDQAIPALGGMPALERVYLWKTQVTAEGAAALRETRPDLTVVLDEAPPQGAGLPAPVILHAPCCEKAALEGRLCDHPCCVKARKEGRMCETCAVPKAGG